ncbi:MAG TPA: hypothetical protein VLB50_05295 [Ignavibacteriaceae bacterium]|nr:hypothetical protein [Ignavibacteriaceae bacterium]
MTYLRISVLLLIFFSLLFLKPLYASSLTDSVETEKIAKNHNKTIENIFIEGIDVSGPSLEDGKNWQPGIFGRIGNSLHTKTKNWVISNYLLFNKGDKLNAWNINESERLLRKTGYFYDARISVEDPVGQDKVNLRVITKDKWTLNPQISYNPKNKNGYAGFKDKNFLGFGHMAEINVTHDEDTYIGWGFKSGYTISNIKGSFVDASVNLESDHKSNMLQLNLTRPFFTINTKWAGGLDFTWQHDDLRYIDRNNKINLIPHSFDSQDLWAGRSFPVWFGKDEFRSNSSFIFSARYYRKHYRLRPPVSLDSNKIFENNRLYLFSFGFINREYFKSFFVDNFGVTEDIPVGGLISLTTGSDEREFYNRWYYGMQIIYSALVDGAGYFSGDFEIGGYRRQNKWEQNVIRINLIYHSPLIYKDKWNARFFLENDYLLGFNRFAGEQIYLDQTSGMAGFNQLVTPGTKRNVLNLEARIFSPYTVLGFVVGGITFVNLGLISRPDKNLLSSRFYQAYGFGLRTQNESISETNFELAVVYNPYNPLYGKGNTEVIFSASFVIGSRDFNFDKPKTIKFMDN